MDGGDVAERLVMSTEYGKLPSASVLDWAAGSPPPRPGSSTGLPRRPRRPATAWRSFELSARQTASGTAPPLTVIRTPPPAATSVRWALGAAPAHGPGRRGARTLWRRPRGLRRPEREDLELRAHSLHWTTWASRPTVTATYSLPHREDRRPGRDRLPVLNVQSTLPVSVSKARSTPSPPPGEAEPARRGRHAPALGLGRPELPNALAARDVDRADRAMVVPPGERPAEVPVLETEVDVPEEELAPLLRRRQLLPGSRTAAVSAAALNT